jgi:type I restriction enzyme S subunit
VASAFLFELLQIEYERLRSVGHGSHQLNLNTQLLGAFEIALPSHAEQTRRALILRALRGEVDANQQVVRKYREIRPGLAADLLSGRVRTAAS